MSERKPKEYLSDEDIMDYHRETVATESEQSELRFTLQAIALWIGKYDAANATIATLTAERDALRGDVQAAIDTIKQNQANPTDKYVEQRTMYLLDRLTTALAQLKEQDDE